MQDFDLDPGMAAFVQRYLEISGRSDASDVARQRRDYSALVDHLRAPRPHGIESFDDAVAGRHGPVPLRHYRAAARNPVAQIVFVHGGGFVLGDLDTHDDICADLCHRSGYDLTSIDYRLAPEFTHPVQLDDVEDAFDACWRPNTILVGASAGATLCAALSYRLRRQDKRAAGQVLVYPMLGGETFELESYRVNARAPLLSSEEVLFYRDVRCAGGEAALDDPELLPLAATDFAYAPPSVVFSADIDPLRDDARLYADKLQSAGVAAEWINEKGLVHDYLRARHRSEAAAAAFTRICEAVTRLASARIESAGR